MSFFAAVAQLPSVDGEVWDELFFLLCISLDLWHYLKML